MRRLRVGVLDLIGNRPTPGLWNRLMKPNFASIMPQVIAVWCEQLGHEVRFLCHTGSEDIERELPPDLDLLFIAAFTNAAQRAAAISSRYRAAGVVTVVGGPHARCYPEDAARYFDYVLGFTDKPLLAEVLRDCAPHRPLGLDALGQQAPAAAARRSRTLEVHRADDRQGAGREDRADDRQPRLPLHLQLLHRLRGRLPAPGTRPDPGGPAFPAEDAEAPARGLARPELRHPLRRDHGGDRGGRPAGRDRVRRREQPLDPDGAAPGAAAARTASGRSCRASSPGTAWAASRGPARRSAARRWTRSRTR